MSDDTNYGEVWYKSYATSTHGKTFDGRDMPLWADLPERIQVAWADASRSLCPACSERRVAVMVDPPLDAGPAGPQSWRRTGDTFESLTLEPSVVVYKDVQLTSVDLTECWHGFVIAGVCS